MDKKIKKQIELHTAGATVRHNNPFSGLDQVIKIIVKECNFLEMRVVL
ncbi:hypothetical protein [Aquimarina rhabdastrellae]